MRLGSTNVVNATYFALDVGSTSANEYASVHALVPKLRSAFRAHPTYFAFYVGDADFFASENVRLHRELVQAGVSLAKVATWMGHSPLVCFRFYVGLVPGGDPDVERGFVQARS